MSETIIRLKSGPGSVFDNKDITVTLGAAAPVVKAANFNIDTDTRNALGFLAAFKFDVAALGVWQLTFTPLDSTGAELTSTGYVFTFTAGAGQQINLHYDIRTGFINYIGTGYPLTGFLMLGLLAGAGGFRMTWTQTAAADITFNVADLSLQY